MTAEGNHMRQESKHVRDSRIAPLAALAVIVMALCVAGCSEKIVAIDANAPTVRSDEIRFPKDAPVIQRLATAPVTVPNEVVMTLPARLAWDEDHTSRVMAPVAGRVTAIATQIGTSVNANQPLAFLASTELGTSQAEGARAQFDLAQAERAAARSKDLAEAGIIAGKDLEQAQTDLARARAESSRTAMRLKALGAGSTVDQRFALRSPIAGVVVERNANPGMEWRPDQPGAPLFVVTDPTYLWCWIDAPEKALGAFSRGQHISVRASALPDEVFDAQIDSVGDALDPTSHTLKVRARLRNPDRRLKSEMYVTASLPHTPKGIGEVPAKAAFLNQGARQIFVKTAEGQFSRKNFIGTDVGDDRIFVESGLKVGDEVVTDGALYLQQLLKNEKPAETKVAM
jgi:membrane fusion protein, heavy metal efflux system